MSPSRSSAMPARLSVSVSPRSQVRSPCPSVKPAVRGGLTIVSRRCCTSLSQRLQRGLRALHVLRQAELLLLGAAHEHQDAVGADAVLLRLHRIDVEVVVGDLELAGLLGQVGEVVVHLVAHLVGRREEHGDLDRLIQVARRSGASPRPGARCGSRRGRASCRAPTPRTRTRSPRSARRPGRSPDSIGAADPPQLQARRARHLGVRQLDQQDRPGGGDPAPPATAPTAPSTASASCAPAAA